MSSFLYLILPALGGYTLTSLYLLKNPLLLHKRKRMAFHSEHISHRGGCGERIESTMEAFTHAVEHGTQMLELDCHLTHDGHVVVSHDENLLRQTGHDVAMSSLNLQISDMVTRYKREEITVWASASSAIMENCQKTNGSMPYMFTMKRGLLLLLLFYTGLLPFVPLGESLLQFYLPRIINRTYIPEKRILRNKLVIHLLEKVTMRKSLFRHLTARGIQVQLFVCNQEEDIRYALEVGATGVMTDYPSLLTSYFSRNPIQD
ncbi:lysophospholipase D GDPD3a isoform X2 [Nelusetta ayraudi]|uniref:lysophospholipase D GDPD3a isoform X2 n=1 Tax=Nelusetta ayraudi TaxID=303726 RepID=UPI003F72E5A7